MKSFINIIFPFFDPDSQKNVDKSIKKFRKSIVKKQLISAEILELESAINNTNDDIKKLDLKRKLRDKLKSIYKEINHLDYIDRAW